MDKNSIIGWVLIGVIMIGFMFFQTRQFEKQAAYQAQLDSIAAVEQYKADSAYRAEHPYDTLGIAERDSVLLAAGQPAPIYKDSLLEAAAAGEGREIVLENDKMVLTLSSKGAQPWSVKLKDYKTYGGGDLYLFKPGQSDLHYTIYAGETINTSSFDFQVVEKTDTSVLFRLPFAGGGALEQYYALSEGSFDVDNEMRFVGMDSFIPRNVFNFDMDWNVTIPRMEKGYKNEVQYSKLDYYFSGDKKPVELGRGRSADKSIANRISWFAFQQQFFSAIMRTEKEFSSGDFSIQFKAEDDTTHNLMACSAAMRYDLAHDGDQTISNHFYFGPNHFHTLQGYGHKYEKIIPLGGWLVGWFTKYVIINLFDFLHKFFSNYGLIILLMTIIVKLVVSPFTFKSYSSSAKMQALKPWMDKLNEKYPKEEDAMKKQQETMALYQRAGINPMGGCLPMLLQFPILWAMFRFFPASIELRQQSFLWAEDLSAYDSIVDFGTRIPLIGDHLSLFALLMAVSMFFYSKLTMSSQPTGNDPNSQMMKFMSVWMMPIMMFFICNSLSSGLSYYYLISNLITMVETWVIRRFFVHPEKIAEKLKASEGKKAPKSKWQQRLEEAQKAQERMMKEQQQQRRR